MIIYVGYHIGDYSDAICMSADKDKVKRRLEKMFGLNFDINDCYICQYILDNKTLIEFDNY